MDERTEHLFIQILKKYRYTWTFAHPAGMISVCVQAHHTALPDRKETAYVNKTWVDVGVAQGKTFIIIIIIVNCTCTVYSSRYIYTRSIIILSSRVNKAGLNLCIH